MNRCSTLPGRTAWLGVAVATALLGATTSAALAQDGPEPAAHLGADFGLYEDDFSQVGVWGQTTNERGSLGYADGAFSISLAEAGASLWSWADFEGKDPTWRIEADVTLDTGPGAGGLMCGSDADVDDFLVGSVDGANEWAIAHIHDGQIGILTGGPLPAPIDLSDGGTTRLVLECAVTGSEADHIRLWADGHLLGSREAAPRIGPYDLVGLFANAEAVPWTATFDDLVMTYGLGYRAPPVSTLGATTEAVSDDFSVSGGWDTPTTDVGAISYDDGSLLIDVTEENGQLWTWRDLSTEAPVLRVEGTMTLDGTGAAGFMCGSMPDDPRFLVGSVSSEREWIILRFASEQATEIAHGLLPSGVDPSDGPVTVAVECADLPGEGTRVAVFADGRFAGAASAVPSVSPLLLVGVYGTSGAGRLGAHVDDLRVLAGEGYAPTPEG